MAKTKIKYFHKLLAGLAGLALLAVIFVGTLSLPLLAGAKSVPSGYADSYSIKSYTPSAAFVELTHSSSATGDHFRAQFYPTTQVNSSTDCQNTGAVLYINGSQVTPSYRTDGQWLCHMEYYLGTGMSLYVAESYVGVNIVQGDINMSTYGSPNSGYTGWYIETAGWAELELSSSLAYVDADGDSFEDDDDNCPSTYNYDQKDTDADDKGDVCDTDDDGDGYSDSSDNCPLNYNADQANYDGDSYGNTCDDDDDNDGVKDSSDNCPEDANSSQKDSDGDGYGDACEDTPGASTTTTEDCSWWDYNGNCMQEDEWGDSYMATDGSGDLVQCIMYSSGTWDCDDENYNSYNSYSYSTCSDSAYDASKGLYCNTCTDQNGDVTSYSCWDNSTTSTSTQMDYSRYYINSDGLYCNEWYNTKGKMTSISCWENTSTSSTCYGCDNSWEERYTEGASCNMETYSCGGTAPCYCEICYDSSNKEIDNTCDDYGTWSDGDDDDDDWSDSTGGWCEYYENTKGESCEKCYDSDGDQTSKSCSAASTGSGYCTWEADDNADWCYRCYEDGSMTSESQCYSEEDGGGEPSMSARDAESQVRELEKSLHWYENDLKEFSRFEKRLERIIKDYEKMLEQMEDDASWWVEEGMDTSVLGELEDAMEGSISEMEDLLGEVGTWYDEFEGELGDLEDVLGDINTSSLTWNEMDAYWLILRKGDKYQMLRDVYDGYIMYHEMNQKYYEWSKEKAKVVSRLDQMGVDIPSDAEDDLEEAINWFAEFEEAFADFGDAAQVALDAIDDVPSFDLDDLSDDDAKQDIRDYFDQDLQYAREDVQWAREDLQVYQWDNGLIWEVLNSLWQLEGAYNSRAWIAEEVGMLREDIADIEGGLEVLTKKITNSTALGKISDVYNVIGEVEPLLDDIAGKAGDIENPEDMEDLWQKLEKIGRKVDPILEYIANYAEKHWNELGLSGSDEEAVERFLDAARDNKGHGECGDRCDRLYDVYDRDVAAMLQGMISDDVVNDLITKITASVMEAVMQHVDEIAFRVTQSILANFELFGHDKFGADFAEDLLNNTSTVQEEILAVAFDEVDVTNEIRPSLQALENLYDDFQALPMPDPELTTEVASYWGDLNDVVSASPSKAELEELVETGENLYEAAVEAKYEYYLGMKDVPGPFDDSYEDTWYAPYVMEGLGDKWNGYKDASGNYTYEYGADNTTLRAEALKMTLNTYGYEVGDGGSTWYSEAQDKGKDLGLSVAYTDLTQPITREESFRLIYEVGTGAGVMEVAGSYGNEFPDVSYNNDWQPVTTLYDYGIVNGQGETGSADFYSNLNRAEFATIMIRTDEVVQSEQAGEDIYSYNQYLSQNQEFSLKNLFASFADLLKAVF